MTKGALNSLVDYYWTSTKTEDEFYEWKKLSLSLSFVDSQLNHDKSYCNEVRNKSQINDLLVIIIHFFFFILFLSIDCVLLLAYVGWVGVDMMMKMSMVREAIINISSDYRIRIINQ